MSSHAKKKLELSSRSIRTIDLCNEIAITVGNCSWRSWPDSTEIESHGYAARISIGCRFRRWSSLSSMATLSEPLSNKHRRRKLSVSASKWVAAERRRQNKAVEIFSLKSRTVWCRKSNKSASWSDRVKVPWPRLDLESGKTKQNKNTQAEDARKRKQDLIIRLQH